LGISNDFISARHAIARTGQDGTFHYVVTAYILIMQALSKPELTALLTAARAHKQRDWLMILLGFTHGLRCSEIVGITVDMVSSGYLDIQRLKGSEHTVQALWRDPDPLYDEWSGVFDYIRGMTSNQKLFPMCRQNFGLIMHRHCSTAGIPPHKAKPHTLKHTCAMQLIDIVGVQNVKKRLGHVSLANTGAYLQVSDEEADAAFARARLL
jgi:integrase